VHHNRIPCKTQPAARLRRPRHRSARAHRPRIQAGPAAGSSPSAAIVRSYGHAVQDAALAATTAPPVPARARKPDSLTDAHRGTSGERITGEEIPPAACSGVAPASTPGPDPCGPFSKLRNAPLTPLTYGLRDQPVVGIRPKENGLHRQTAERRIVNLMARVPVTPGRRCPAISKG
jgi:hypothetical protein